MRALAGLAITFGVAGVLGIAAGAAAQTSQAIPESGARLLMDAAFSRGTVSDQAFGVRAPADDSIADLLDQGGYKPGVGPTRWSVDQMVRAPSADGAAIDTLRISTGGVLRTPGGLPLNLDRGEYDTKAYEIMLARDWPAAISLESERYNLDFTPHAGLGMSNLGGAAEAGAMVTFGQKAPDETIASRLARMGVRDGAGYGGAGRWYLFAAASGRAVGLNMLKDAPSGWDRALSQDSASTLIGDAQVGVGWRKGPLQTSLGYIHRQVRGDHMIWGEETKDDSMVAFSFSIRPRR